MELLPSAAELTRVVLSDVAPERQTLQVYLLFHSLADAYLRALEERRPLDLIHWFSQRREQAHDIEVVELVHGACASLIAHLSSRRGSQALLGPLCALSSGLDGKPTIASEMPAPFHRASAVDAAVNDVVRRLERHDPYTGDRARCVSDWCARLARRLGLLPAETLFVMRSGLVHDCGMLSIPPEIVNADRALDDQEIAAIRSHAIAGERLARESPLLAPFAAVIRSHHERFDGLGYPDGLSGNDIPSAARVVAVAAAFVAMVGRHPVRFPMVPLQAIAWLEAERGKRFDGDIVDVMRGLLTSHLPEHTDKASVSA
jgi:HD-GYP domain-containing protein (c-di-GMP phosphodiesterase class II)